MSLRLPFVASMLTVVMVAGCGGSFNGAFPGSSSSAAAVSTHAKDLLYLSDVHTNVVYVYSFPQGRLVGTLGDFGAPRSECSDNAGNVWIADVSGYDVIEYAHGGTAAIAALSTPSAPQGCSVDPVTGALAVTSNARGGVVLLVFRHAPNGRWRDPIVYADSSMHRSMFCGYDSAGNLFVDGVDKAQRFRLDELVSGAAALKNVAVSQKIAVPGQVQWDGKYVTIGDAGVSPSKIYQFTITSSSATEWGSTTLGGTTSVRQFWIQGNAVIGPDYDKDVGFWPYPAGGSASKILSRVHGYGATISVASH
jgi:hypothetical protein